jgi:hypothetical protein
MLNRVIFVCINGWKTKVAKEKCLVGNRRKLKYLSIEFSNFLCLVSSVDVL